MISRQIHENHEILRIPRQNYENHENLIIQLQNHKIKKFIEFHARITKIIKI